jgi:hypothetical protein
MSDESLDARRIEKLATEILLCVRVNYCRGSVSRDRCFEALNALAFCVADVVQGCDGQGGEAHEFFVKALNMQFLDLAEHGYVPKNERN